MIPHPTASPGCCGGGHEPHPSGCGPGELACTLDCPTRPVFHCGQLLTEAHLNAVTGWVSDRLRLQQFHDGWGVACGLELRCDPDAPNRLRIMPGYAVGCCGDDLVLCEEACLDLAEACRRHPTGCADPASPADEAAACEIAGRPVYRSQLVEVDILLDPAEQERCHVSAPGCGCPAPGGKPVPTVVRETARPGWALAKDPPDRWKEFEAAWQACARVVAEARAVRGARRRAVLMAHPAHRFCWLRAIIADAKDDRFDDDAWLAEVLFWLVADCRQSLLDRGCLACSVHDRLRLGRVWLLTAADYRGRRGCQVVRIEETPPYRRRLHRDGPPQPRLERDLSAIAFWRPAEEAEAALAAEGMYTAVRARDVPKSLDELEALLAEAKPLPAGTDAVTLLVVERSCLGIGRRVVGWQAGLGDGG